MRSHWIPIWKKAPFVRLIIPVIIGVILQGNFQFELEHILLAAICFSIAFIAFHLFPLSVRFKLQVLHGFIINLLLIVLGMFVTHQKDIRNDKSWFGNFYQDSDYVVATINEPLLEKNKSYKAEATIENVINDSSINTNGKIIIYFQKDTTDPISLAYGDKLLINKKLQEIKNSGNPGAFNYQRYSAFHQTFHNVFLKKKDWVLLDEKNIDPFKQFLFSARKNVLQILQTNLKGKDDQLAIAEALLIGYTADLDKDLVQAYSNTGVVHIIAISGMHLGLIYIMLIWLFNRIPVLKRSKIIKVICILSCLWLFTLLTGGSASILRAAVMFTCIVIGENIGRNSSIYNSLAASAFILLCYNPYFLWDVGFQLSYLAVLGIVIFQKPIYHLIYIKNKFINPVWQLMSVAVAAQILTFPVCLYYFHQFPTLFLITNVLLVPLSSLILFVEILLVAFSWIPSAALYLGKITWALIWLMNKIILWFNSLPYSVWDRIPATALTTFLLYAFVFAIGYWLLNKNKAAFKFSLISLLCFTVLNGYSKIKSYEQQKLIVYNVPQHQAIDVVEGNHFKFIGDSILLIDGMLQNFHLKPARIFLQLDTKVDSLSKVFGNNNVMQLGNKKVLLIDKPFIFQNNSKIDIDYIIISKNPRVSVEELASVFNCRQFVFDASNSLWKIDNWKKECEKLHLRCYSVPENGAFVVDF